MLLELGMLLGGEVGGGKQPLFNKQVIVRHGRTSSQVGAGRAAPAPSLPCHGGRGANDF